MKSFPLLVLLPLWTGAAFAVDDPIRIDAPEQEKIDFTKSDGGMPKAPGLKTFVVFRADKENPPPGAAGTFTYHHHPDLAAWKGRLYAGWDSCETDEDTWPSHELYSTSVDGEHWSAPAELFPQGVSTPLRMYFFHAPNGRMLVIAGLRMNHEKTDEKLKGGLVVREIRADYTLGPVFTLRSQPGQPAETPKDFTTSDDAGFVEAGKQLLASHTFLEQQDYGLLLDPADRMRWNDPEKWEGDAELKKAAVDFGKAMSFFHRGKDELVGVGKKGWVTVSRDEGKTWQQPVHPASLVTGMGKVWGQKMSDGRYALVYDPHIKIRQPLVVVTSDDGVTFRHMFAIHGELPALRYPGKAKSMGASYPRGLSEWSNDGTWKDGAMWIIYSAQKEQIWVSRIPVKGDKE